MLAVLITASFFNQLPDNLIPACIIVGAFIGAGNSLNDFFDYSTDLTNRPTRPLPSGLISKTKALLISIFFFITGSLIFLPIRTFFTTVLLLINLFLLILYTPIFKSKPLLGNIIVSYLLGSTFLFSAALFGNYHKGIIPAILAFLFNLARELIKDIEDVSGDRMNGIETLPVKLGISTSKLIVAIFMILILIGSLLPYLLNIYGIYYFFAVIITVDVPLLFLLNYLRKSENKKEFARLSGYLKSLVFCGLLSIYLGKF